MILDNNGYSNNNEMSQGVANNLYPNEPQKPQKRQNPQGVRQESRQTKGMFIVGLLTGILAQIYGYGTPAY